MLAQTKEFRRRSLRVDDAKRLAAMIGLLSGMANMKEKRCQSVMTARRRPKTMK